MRKTLIDFILKGNYAQSITIFLLSGESGKDLAKKAMKHWEEKTCLKFVERTDQKYYAEFQYDGLVYWIALELYMMEEEKNKTKKIIVELMEFRTNFPQDRWMLGSKRPQKTPWYHLSLKLR